MELVCTKVDWHKGLSTKNVRQMGRVYFEISDGGERMVCENSDVRKLLKKLKLQILSDLIS